jgi:hypothetical protein
MAILDTYRAGGGNYILDSQAVSAAGTTVTASTGNSTSIVLGGAVVLIPNAARTVVGRSRIRTVH